MTRNAKNKTPATAKAEAAPAKKPRVGPFQYLAQVRKEANKVTWTPWNETWISTVMVLILAVLAMLFFWVVDFTMNAIITWLLSLGA